MSDSNVRQAYARKGFETVLDTLVFALNQEDFRDALFAMGTSQRVRNNKKVGDEIFDRFMEYRRTIELKPIKIAQDVYKVLSPLFKESYDKGLLFQDNVISCRGIMSNKLLPFQEAFSDEKHALSNVDVRAASMAELKRLFNEEFGVDIEMASTCNSELPVFDFSWASPLRMYGQINALQLDWPKFVDNYGNLTVDYNNAVKDHDADKFESLKLTRSLDSA